MVPGKTLQGRPDLPFLVGPDTADHTRVGRCRRVVPPANGYALLHGTFKHKRCSSPTVRVWATLRSPAHRVLTVDACSVSSAPRPIASRSPRPNELFSRRRVTAARRRRLSRSACRDLGGGFHGHVGGPAAGEGGGRVDRHRGSRRRDDPPPSWSCRSAASLCTHARGDALAPFGARPSAWPPTARVALVPRPPRPWGGIGVRGTLDRSSRAMASHQPLSGPRCAGVCRGRSLESLGGAQTG